MVFENYTYYDIYNNIPNKPKDEILYHRMYETSNIFNKTDNGNVYHNMIYKPRIPFKSAKLNEKPAECYVNCDNQDDLITYHSALLFDRISERKKSWSVFFKDLLCCRCGK